MIVKIKKPAVTVTPIDYLKWAEIIDSYRVFPRILICGYALFVYKITFWILVWYGSQPATARGPEESAVVGVVVTAVTGFAPWLFKIYSENGRDWNQLRSDT